MPDMPALPRPLDDAARWAAVQARDAAADGRFVYSVATTGVYCRPSCASRPARRENVAFHATNADAEAAGFRPCRRCRPNGESPAEARAAAVARACRIIDAAEEPPTLADLAAAVGLSPHHLHRAFRAATGLTPRDWAAARRAERARAGLAAGKAVTTALYDAGFNASSRFYEAAPAILGMRPAQFRAGGRDAAIRHAVAPSTLGLVLVAATDRGVCAIEMGDEAEALVASLRRRFPNATFAAGDAAFAQLVGDVVALVDGRGDGAALPLDIRGTAFQQSVWQALREIPPGTTLSYAELADRLGRPTAARAVAAACAANSLAVAIPCHRIVRGDGSLSGYRWGVARKRALLQRERGEA